MSARIGFSTFRFFYTKALARTKFSASFFSNPSLVQQTSIINSFVLRQLFSSNKKKSFWSSLYKDQQIEYSNQFALSLMFSAPIRTFLFNPEIIEMYKGDLKQAKQDWITRSFVNQYINGRNCPRDAKDYSLDDFKLEYSFEDFENADIIRDMHTNPFMKLKEDLFEAFSEVEYRKCQNDEIYWPEDEMYGEVVSKKYPKLQKGEKTLSYEQFVATEMLNLEDFSNQYIIKTLIEKNPEKYEELMGHLYQTYASCQYKDYKIAIGFYENKLSFEDYQKLYCISIEEFEKRPYLKKLITNGTSITDEEYRVQYRKEIDKAYEGYCKVRYYEYETACEYGPYYNPATIL